jgi:hypothetical protein
MKIVYSYIPHNYVEGQERFLPKKIAYVLMLSVLQARKLYKDVELYTNPEQAKFFKRLGIPFTRIDTLVLEHENANCPSIPKLKTYAAQTQPFIHIDLDTVLFEKVPIAKNRPVLFAHSDFGGGVDYSCLNSIYTSYINPLTEAKDQLPDFYTSNYDHAELPNMNTVVVQDVELFKNATQRALDSYYKVKDIIDADYMRFCLPEQAFIHLELKKLSEEYAQMVRDDVHTYSKRVFTAVSNQGELPFSIVSKTYINDKITINKVEDIFKIKDYNFGGVMHLLGSLKDDIYIKAIVLHLIVTRFGGTYATNISKAYGTELDEGEELYKNYTGHKFNNLL